MKKSHPFNVLHEKKKCIDCPTHLKKRIAEEHPKAKRCFQCHVTSEGLRGHRMKG